MIFLPGKARRRASDWVRKRGVARDGYFFDDIRADDTYLVSFPRSGNTYLRHLVASLVLDRPPVPGELQEVVPDVHRSATTARPPGAGPLVAKSHAPARQVPANVVYLVRDGRAALVSYHRYLLRRGQPAPARPDDMLAWPDVWPCPWPDHVSGWLHQVEGRDGSEVVRYEDLVAEPAAVLGRVAALAGLSCTDGAIERAVQHSSVERMQAAEREGAPGLLNFVATGQGGSWSEVLGRDALGSFEARCGELLSRFGYPASAPADG